MSHLRFIFEKNLIGVDYKHKFNLHLHNKDCLTVAVGFDKTSIKAVVLSKKRYLRFLLFNAEISLKS